MHLDAVLGAAAQVLQREYPVLGGEVIAAGFLRATPALAEGATGVRSSEAAPLTCSARILKATL